MAKKKAAKKKRPVAPGVDPNEKRRERLEQKRAQRVAQAAAQKKAEQRAKIIRWVTIAALFSLAVWFVWFRTQAPSSFNGHPVEAFNQAGVQQHTDDPVQYESTPPVAGAHNAQIAGCGVFAEPLQNELMVHNLEHGAVGITYEPTLDPETIAEIESIVSSYNSHTFSAPYEGQDTPISVIAWGYLMRLDELDEGAVRDFIEEFRQNGPEENQCPNGSAAPFGSDVEPSPAAEVTIPPTDEEDGGGGGGRKGNKKGED